MAMTVAIVEDDSLLRSSLASAPDYQLSTFTCDKRSYKDGGEVYADLSDSFFCDEEYDALYAKQAVTAGSTYAYVNPSISSLSPSSGTTSGGTTVTITGAGLAGASGVTIGGNAAAIVSNSGTQIVITTPAGGLPGPESLVVTVAGNTASSTYTYTAPAPAITSINPTTGSTDGGTTVTITGTDLGGVTSVTFALTPWNLHLEAHVQEADQGVLLRRADPVKHREDSSAAMTREPALNHSPSFRG